MKSNEMFIFIALDESGCLNKLARKYLLFCELFCYCLQSEYKLQIV